MQRAEHQYDRELDITGRESKTAETAWAACNKDPKLWPGDEAILLLVKANKTETFELCCGRPCLPLS